VLLTVLVITGDDTLTWTPSPVAWPTLGILPALAFLPLLSPLARRPALAADATPSPTASTSRPAEVAPA
jgi:hypothetical protein